MQRRTFLKLGGGAVAGHSVFLPLATLAQQAARTMPRIGVLTLLSSGETANVMAFRRGLRERGFIEGQNIVLDIRAAAGKPELLALHAADLVAQKVDVIYAMGSQASRAAREATTIIPIVMLGSDPVGLGFVASLARPGGNITGVSMMTADVSGKRVELLKEIAPDLKSAVVIFNSDDPATSFAQTETEAAAEKLKLKLQTFAARDGVGIENAIRAAVAARVDCVIPLSSPLMSENAARMGALTLAHRLPAIYVTDVFTKAGGLISYGASPSVASSRAAYFVERILKGDRPSDLPVEQPTKFELVINLKTARTFSINIPLTVLALANEVVE